MARETKAHGVGVGAGWESGGVRARDQRHGAVFFLRRCENRHQDAASSSSSIIVQDLEANEK